MTVNWKKDPNHYCPICGGRGKAHAVNGCPKSTLSAINAAHSRDPEMEPSDLVFKTYSQRLHDGFETMDDEEEP